MAITYTISWQCGVQESADAKTKTRQAFIVAEAGESLNPISILTAREKTTNAVLPNINDAFPGDPAYFLQDRGVSTKLGPHACVMTLVYGRGQAVDRDDESSPIQYRVRNGISSEATDADVNGNALLNTAGVPFSGTVQANISAIFIDAIRTEGAYNLPQAVAFTNKVNADSFNLAGYTISPGEAYCLGIQPESQYTLQDETVAVVYSFEIRERLTLQNGSRITAFIHRLLDQGQQGWTYNDQLVQMFHANGDGGEVSPVSSDVLLNEGIPLEPDNYTNPDINFDPADGRGWANAVDRAPNAERDKAAGTSPTFLLYQKHLTANFGELGLA